MSDLKIARVNAAIGVAGFFLGAFAATLLILFVVCSVRSPGSVSRDGLSDPTEQDRQIGILRSEVIESGDKLAKRILSLEAELALRDAEEYVVLNYMTPKEAVDKAAQRYGYKILKDTGDYLLVKERFGQ